MPPKKRVRKSDVPLEKYLSKRNFAHTPEPSGKPGKKTGHSFVVQEHHARSHHFDFRLEMEGVLVSWAVPKGVPEEQGPKRLAVHVEDHPLEYGGFQGTIPKGNYGAGTVAIWDAGEWEPLDKNWQKAFKKGKMKFLLHGKRLHGEYLLARMGEEPNWLLRKISDDNLAQSSARPEREIAGFISPQLARPVPSVPSGEEWMHELKLDGYRLIAVQRAGKVQLFTRKGLDWTHRFEKLAGHLAGLTKKDFVLDGEAVVFDAKGRSRFGDLQQALQEGDREAICYVAFDLLHFDGLNLRKLPLAERVKFLGDLVTEETGPVRRSAVWTAGAGVSLFLQACKNGLEGIISKNARGIYQDGERRDWAKSKCRARQEFVICGYTAPKGALPAFGALVLGSFENGKLITRGKVGTGFTGNERRRLLKLFQPYVKTEATFPAMAKDITWMKPHLVAEIEFAEITRDGSIRQGAFLGLREDKMAGEVHLDGFQVASVGKEKVTVMDVNISHPERIIYPGTQISKVEVVRYYERVGKLMLPFVANRPLAIIRAPEGIGGQTFFQKSFPKYVPPHVLQSELKDGTMVFHIKNVKGLIALAQFGAIEIHPWGSRLDQPDKPDFLIWDLDPDEAVPWEEVLGAAILIRDFLAGYGLDTLLKTSGGKGLHLMLHIRRTHEWDVMKAFTKAVAARIAELNPRRFITTASKAKRKGRIFIDWLRNGKGSTCVAPWSLRARSHAPISMPIDWAKLESTTAAGFTIHEPPQIPDQWHSLKVQSITASLLKEMGA